VSTLRTSRIRSRVRNGVSALGAFVLAACHGDVASSAGPPDLSRARLVPLYGDQVNGEPGAEEAESLTVALLSQSGRPIPGMRITWTASNGGSVQNDTALTDATGLARTVWAFGADAVTQSAKASFMAVEVSFRGLLRLSPPIPIDSLVPLAMTTFDGSGQVVHPDVVFLPHSWDGGKARLAMAITPYPYGDPRQENPSLYVSDGGPSWTALSAGKNPVVAPTTGYLSDPSIAFDDGSHELRLYYRQVVNGENVIWLVTSADGIEWSDRREVVRVPSDLAISPSVVRRSATEWLMWSVNGGASGCAGPDTHVDLRRSADGIHWGDPARVVLDQAGGYPWHIDVKWIGALHEYWALYNLKIPGNCATPAVYLATSSDGVQWTTYPRPVLQRGASTAFADIVYRSSFVYTKMDDMITFYYSGARWDGAHYVWSGAIQRRLRSAVFANLQASGTFTVRPSRSDLPSPERTPR
jgi:hypothetical protein